MSDQADILKYALLKNPQSGMQVYTVRNNSIVPLGNVSSTERKYRSRGKAELIELVPKMDDLFWRVKQLTHVVVYRVDELILQSGLTDEGLAQTYENAIHDWRLACRSDDDIIFYLQLIKPESQYRQSLIDQFMVRVPYPKQAEYMERLQKI